MPTVYTQTNKKEVLIKKMRLPLVEDNYNISVVISFPVIKNRGSKYCDFIENVYFFRVEEHDMKLWDRVYIENDCDIVPIK